MKMNYKIQCLGFCLVGVLVAGAARTAAAGSFQESRLPKDELPAELGLEVPFGLPEHLAADPADAPIAALGRRLFFDPVLSADRSLSCASCHIPERGFADNQRFSEGLGGKRTLRNTPTLFNRALGVSFMWDGQAASLEEQVLLPIENPLELGLELELAIERLSREPGYAAAFEEVFGAAPSQQALGRALAAFVRRLLSGDSRVDRFRVGDRDALSRAERGGLWFFESRGACWQCHSGPNFSDEEFHNTGIGVVDGRPEAGRRAISGLETQSGAFKTPTLRALSLTAPYMHDGSLETLEAVVEFYRQGGHPNSALDAKLKPIEMSDSDASNLVAFLQAL